MERDAFPVRPHIPASASASVGALLTSGALLEGAWRAVSETGSASIPFSACALGLFFAGVCAAMGQALPRWRPHARWFALGIVLAVFASWAWVASWQGRCDAVADADLGACRFIVRGDPSVNKRGASMSALVRDASGQSLGAVRLTADHAYENGTELTLVARRKRLDGSDWARSRFMKGEVASVDAVRVRGEVQAAGLDPIARFRLAALAAIDPGRSDARALVAGIVCGRTTELNRSAASDDFAATGLTHLVAVSGSHLAFIAILFQGALQRMRVGVATRAALLVAVMSAYVVFTGCAPSAVRSVAMVGCGMATSLGGRRAHPLSGLALTVLVLVLIDPGTTFDLGFQLSASSVLFILVFARYLAHLIGKLRVPSAVAEGLALTLAAQWATVPIIVPVFGTVSLIAPAANLLAAPVMSALLVVGLVVVPACTLVPALVPLMAVAEGMAHASIFLADLLARVPFASVPVSMTAVQLVPLQLAAIPCFLFWVDWKARQVAMVGGVAILTIAGHIARWALFAPAAVTVLDVGQADAILLRDGRSSLLVDAGVDDEVVAALARAHVYRLDAVAVTHWDRDHWGGLPDLLETVAVDRILVPEGAADAVPGEVRDAFRGKIVELRAGDVLRVGGFVCKTVWPRSPVTGEENADSLCLDVSYRQDGRELRALLTGDTERDELESYRDEVGDIDVLKVGHHGSKVSVDAASLGVLDPEVAIASAGAGNSYGHPSGECVEVLKAAGATFLCTIEAGDITVYPAKGGIRVDTSRAHQVTRSG